MAEFILALAGDQFSSLQIVEIGFESDSSQGNDDAQIFQSFELHEVAGGVAGKGAAGAIGAVRAGSESEHEDAGMGIAESGNGLSPVLVVAVSAALLAGNLLAILDQTRAERAGNDFRIQNIKPVRKGH